MKVLNLYAGIGGNRKLWEDVDVTAVEYNKDIAGVYKEFFPDDIVIVGDAHEYLLNNFNKFDFIWASPPCPTHSKLNTTYSEKGNKNTIEYPNMELYQEIIILKHFFKGKYCVENVITYYDPLIPPQEVHKHYFWANFHITDFPAIKSQHLDDLESLYKIKGFNLSDYKLSNKRQILRNCINPHLGNHILEQSKNSIHPELF